MTTTSLKFADGFHEVLCLLYYDGPLLSYYRDTIGRHFLVLWVDEVGDDWIYYAMEFQTDDLAKYFKDELDLLGLMERAVSIHECVDNFVDTDGAVGKKIEFTDIPEDRKPKPDAFCEVPEAIKHLQ